MAVEWYGDKITAQIRAGVLRGVITGTEAVLEEGTRLIASPPKTGRIYKRYNPRRLHQASAPGEAPASDLGALIASGRTIYPDQQDLLVISGVVNWSTAYARRLELGDEKIEPRPYARPALAKVSPTFAPSISAEVAEALKA